MGGIRRSLLATIWARLPVIVRSVLTGLVVYVVGAQPPFALVFLNLQLAPAVPWSVPLVAAYLWFFWRYLNGWGWPHSTSDVRRRNLRAQPLSSPLWTWSLLAGGLAMTAFCAIEFLGQRFVPSDPPRLLDLSHVSPMMFVLTYLMVSVIAGVVEESAFRGYMQSPLERRYGPFAGISIVAVLFTLAHLGVYPSMSLPQALSLLAISYTYGLLAILTGSILPGLVIHAAGNAVAFLFCWWYSRSTGSLRVPLFWESGPDRYFWANCVGAVFFAAAAVYACRRFAVVLRRERKDRVPALEA